MATFTIVDKEECIACGACVAEAPDVFAEDDAGIAYNLVDDNAGNTDVSDFADDVKFAAEGCPTEAIKIQDSEF